MSPIIGIEVAFGDVFDTPVELILNPPHPQTSLHFGGIGGVPLEMRSVMVVPGNKRYHPFYGDPTMVGYDHPGSVDVTFANGQRRIFRNMEMVSVRGPSIRLDVPIRAVNSPSVRAKLVRRVPILGKLADDTCNEKTALERKALQRRVDYCLGCDVIGADGPPTKYGDYATVLAVQKALKALGKPTLDPKKVDGLWGPNTAKAVRALKIEGNQTSLDGGIDDWVLNALGLVAPSKGPGPAPAPPAPGPAPTPAPAPPAPGPAPTPTPAPPAPGSGSVEVSFWDQPVWQGGPTRLQGTLGALAVTFVTGSVVALARR